MASNSYHEPVDRLSPETLDMHRALVSLMEELEAVDWYQQRIDSSSDPQLKSVLLHNKNEEIEHAAMLMEWIRSRDDHFATNMRKYLFSGAPIAGLEKGPEPLRTSPDIENPHRHHEGKAAVDLLKRKHAPITPEAWMQIDNEAMRVLRLGLAGRKVVDVDGPHGWLYAAVNTGSLKICSEGGLGVPWGIRGVVPLIELRVPFELAIMDLDNASRGATLDLPAVVIAAQKTAHAEDTAIFNGFEAGAIAGIIPSCLHRDSLPNDYAGYPSCVSKALETLQSASVNGPYVLALGPDRYAGLAQAAVEGNPVREQVESILGAPMVLAPQIEGAVLLSQRGGDYQLSVGQDLSVGYAGHDKDNVYLFLTESFAFRVLDRKAAVYLTPHSGRK